jgi:nucleoid DNA-binding protein
VRPNPRTGAEIDIPASTSIRFKPGKTLKDGERVTITVPDGSRA